MRYQHISVEPLTPTIGAVISGVNLGEKPASAVFSEIKHAWLEHLVLFFYDQSITPEQQLNLGHMLGELHIHPAAPYRDNNPALMAIHTGPDSHRNNGDTWHSDVSADEEPPKASILYLQTSPKVGGDTLWANMYAAYDALSSPIKALLAPLSAKHSANYSGYYGDHLPQRSNPSAEHPVIRTHPETGRKALFVNQGFTRGIVGLSDRESQALLQMLFDHIKHPQFHCRFHWRENTIALWDNRCTQHLAVWDYFPAVRSGTRVTVKGDRPY
ncbi:MAG: TauD/TfdA dioxygenase family protein [Pseudomonadales bacterium]